MQEFFLDINNRGGGGVIVRNLVKWWKGCFRTRETFEKLKKNMDAK